ncbi:MAG TPA: hypothetical protein V6D28_05740 [Leptolyngbyaceae cyanobacterium]
MALLCSIVVGFAIAIMTLPVEPLKQQEIVYPDSDGQPIAENT